MRSPWITGVGPKSNDRGPYKAQPRGMRQTEEEKTQMKMPGEDRGRGWNYAATNLGTPGATRSWKRQRGILP